MARQTDTEIEDEVSTMLMHRKRKLSVHSAVNHLTRATELAQDAAKDMLLSRAIAKQVPDDLGDHDRIQIEMDEKKTALLGVELRRAAGKEKV